jgi:hypothetical protein
MSAYSDWKCGALSDEEFAFEMRRECYEAPFDDPTPNVEREPMTLEAALKIAECINLDYGKMDEDEIDEMDEAVDMVFAAAYKWLKTQQTFFNGTTFNEDKMREVIKAGMEKLRAELSGGDGNE